MNQINSRLTSLRLSGMSQCWKTLSETHKLNELSLADGMEMLLQSEEDQRSANRYARLLKNANFRYKASVEELNVEATRGIDRSLLPARPGVAKVFWPLLWVTELACRDTRLLTSTCKN